MYNKKEKLVNWFHMFFTFFQIINFSLFIFLAGNIVLFDRPKNRIIHLSCDFSRYSGVHFSKSSATAR